MKIVHLSDIHVWRYTWDPRRLLGRRALGIMELLMGRARRFQLDRLAAVVDRVGGLQPDHILITGDLTTTALPSEFRDAARLLAPLLTDPARISIVPGNHDRATGRSLRSRRFEGTFGAFMPALTFPWLRHLDGATAILGLDPTRTRFSPARQVACRSTCGCPGHDREPRDPAQGPDRGLSLPCGCPAAVRARTLAQAAGQRAGRSGLALGCRAAPLLLWTRPRRLGVPAGIAAEPGLPQRRRSPDA